mmetsp:Transcript_19547/g.48989  ORF Transcript_19547/g.48989 Transcript_19547/m.48989 type:complete len:288 (+) Transcript_19547:1573-2436(+)
MMRHTLGSSGSSHEVSSTVSAGCDTSRMSRHRVSRVFSSMCLKKSSMRENLRMPSMSSAVLSSGFLNSASLHLSHDLDWVGLGRDESLLLLRVLRSAGGAIASLGAWLPPLSADLKTSTAFATKSSVGMGWQEYKRTTKNFLDSSTKTGMAMQPLRPAFAASSDRRKIVSGRAATLLWKRVCWVVKQRPGRPMLRGNTKSKLHLWNSSAPESSYHAAPLCTRTRPSSRRLSASPRANPHLLDTVVIACFTSWMASWPYELAAAPTGAATAPFPPSPCSRAGYIIPPA